jgi:hypothetical protein
MLVLYGGFECERFPRFDSCGCICWDGKTCVLDTPKLFVGWGEAQATKTNEGD